MMTIEVRINGRLVASAVAVNQSNLDPVSDNLDPVSDYTFRADETRHPVSGKNPKVIDSTIKNHYRSDSVWSLVEKIASAAKED